MNCENCGHMIGQHTERGCQERDPTGRYVCICRWVWSVEKGTEPPK